MTTVSPAASPGRRWSPRSATALSAGVCCLVGGLVFAAWAVLFFLGINEPAEPYEPQFFTDTDLAILGSVASAVALASGVVAVVVLRARRKGVSDLTLALAITGLVGWAGMAVMLVPLFAF